MTKTIASPLQTVIGEFKNIAPEISTAFIFEKNGEILAASEGAAEQEMKNLISTFNGLSQKAKIIGGVEDFTIQGADSQLNIEAIDGLFLATVSSKAANQKTVKSLTQVVIPTIVKLLDRPHAVLDDSQPQPEKAAEETPEAAVSKEEPKEEKSDEQTAEIITTNEKTRSFSSEPPLSKPPVNQVMVEKISGLLVRADTVLIDNDVISNWRELYDNKEITTVCIETLEGKTTTCKFKPIKDGRSSAKGIIQVPERILQSLQTNKGKLVMVKPVVE